MLSLTKLIVVIFIINVLSTLYVIFLLVNNDTFNTIQVSNIKISDDMSYKMDKNEETEDNEEKVNDYNIYEDSIDISDAFKYNRIKINSNQIIRNIEIWSKAAVGDYIWEHIFGGKIYKQKNGGFHFFDLRKISNYNVMFRSGPSLTIESLKNYLIAKLISRNQYIINIVLILNGRSEDKVKYSKAWLNEVDLLCKNYSTNHVINVGAVLLGNENCFNNWIKHYLATNGGPLKFLFIIYDWEAIDNDVIHQWPLGVATYRNFPKPDVINIDTHLTRPYICNFLGTIYFNTSRLDLFKVLNRSQQCLFKPRFIWQSNESQESLQRYLESLRLSDLTLNPIGMNHECYRIYEAFSFASVPVLEENLDHVKGQKSDCDKKSAYRLLKKFKAPLIFVKNWTTDLPLVIEDEIKMSQKYKVNRRKKLIKWYEKFKRHLRDKFLSVIEKKFFSNQT